MLRKIDVAGSGMVHHRGVCTVVSWFCEVVCHFIGILRAHVFGGYFTLTVRLQVSTLAGSPNVAGYADGPGPSAQFHTPVDVTVDLNGVLFVVDTTSAIRQVTPNGHVSSVAGTPFLGGNPLCSSPCIPADGVGTVAEFRLPMGITIDASGGMFLFRFLDHVRLLVVQQSLIQVCVYCSSRLLLFVCC